MANLTRALSSRPGWRTLTLYESEVERAVSDGDSIPAPSTVKELQYLIDAYPLRAIPFLPSPEWRDRLGISQNACREPEPLSIEWREQFVATLAIDQEFAEAVRRWIGGAS